MTIEPKPSRRLLLAGAAIAPFAVSANAEANAPEAAAEPFPLSAVRLKPSLYARAVEANRAYLHALEPDRLLHSFRTFAGLEPKGAIYGGWESDSLAGHTLGHYLSACALMHAQTGDEECKRRVEYIVAELAAVQSARGEGYFGALTRRRPDGAFVDGRVIFDEIAAGDIRPAKFNLNGAWSPIYTVHKQMAGLLDAHLYCGVEAALPVAQGLARFLETKFAPLSEEQMQRMLACEFGGMPEALAELSVRAGEPRWMALAARFWHRAVMNPLAERRDSLSFIHANTQVPKAIAAARMYEISGAEQQGAASQYFWDTVATHRSYVIGGNSDREYFQEPNSISKYITEQTCESCNTYNMLKLTRHLYKRQPSAAYFDYFERAHLNHIMAQHRESDGMFAYMVPLISGGAREWSQPTESFWCCVGSGMESHAKHGESIFWRDRRGLIVNLFIPSELSWEERGARIALETDYPYGERVMLRMQSLPRGQTFSVALRKPAWCEAPRLAVNGRAIAARVDARGYLSVRRFWREGDRIELDLPLSLRAESTPDDPDTIALLHGPLVLAADLGAADRPFDGLAPAPALVSADVLASVEAVDASAATFRTRGAGQPADMSLAPFYRQHDRRTAVYFKRYTPAQWQEAQAAFARERARIADLDGRSVDAIKLGDETSERAHRLTSDISYPVSYRFRPGRDARTEGFFEFDAAVAQGAAMTLRATYWGGERERHFHILVDGQRIATQRLDGERAGEWIDVEYAIPAALTARKRKVRVRFQPVTGHTAGPCFGVRLLRT